MDFIYSINIIIVSLGGIAFLGHNKKSFNWIKQILVERIKMKINKNKSNVGVCRKKEQKISECIKEISI